MGKKHVPSFLDEDYCQLHISLDLDRLLLGENDNDDLVFLFNLTQPASPRLAPAIVWELVMMPRQGVPMIEIEITHFKAESAKVDFNNGL